MTNNLRNMLAQYIAGKITVENENNIPTIEDDTTRNDLDEYLKTELAIEEGSTYTISSTLNVENLNIVSGYYNKNSADPNFGFILLLDEDFNIIKLFKNYSSGTAMSPFYQVAKDENNFLYAIDKSDEKFRFVMLNNPSVKENDDYTIIMRQTYFLPDEYQDTSSVLHEFTMLRKSPANAEYYFIGQLSGSSYTSTIPFLIHLKINVGSENEWQQRIVNNFNTNFTVTDCIITYGFSNENNEDNNLIVLCGYTGSVADRKFVQISIIGQEETSNTYSYDFNWSYRLDAKMISETETYIAVTKCRGQTGNDRLYQNLEIYHRVNDIYTLIYTYSSYSPTPPVKLFKNDNYVYCMFMYGLVFSGESELSGIVPIFIACYDNYAVADKYSAVTGLTYNDLMIVQVAKVNNIVSAYVQYPEAVIKFSYYRSNENTYNTIDCLRPEYFNLRALIEPGKTLMAYSKDFSNISRIGNVCTCIGNIPNTELNDLDIEFQYVYSRSNLYMGLQSHQFTKNIYENLYLNYIYGYFFQNQNKVQSNMIDNSSLLMQATLEQGYNNFYIAKIEVTYEDNTTEDFNLTSSIENLYTAHFTCQFTPTKNVTMIKMTNTNKTITFLEIPTNLVAGKQYEFTQDIEVV